MPTELIHGAGDETVNQPRDPRRPTRTPDIRLNNQRTILGDRTNVGASNSYVPNLDSVKQRIPGANRLSTKNLKRPSRGVELPCSPLALDHTPIPYKKDCKDTTHSVLTPKNLNLVLKAVINPKIARQGGVWSMRKQQVSEPPTETVTVQPDGTIQRVQTAHGDPQYALLPELTDEDLEGLDDTPVWTSSLLEQIDFTPAQWIDPPATTVGDTISAEPVNPPTADPPSGSRPLLIHDPPCIVSSYSYDTKDTLSPCGSAVVDEHISGGACINCCKEGDDKLTLVTESDDVNDITIGRHCKREALAGIRIDRRLQDSEEQTQQALLTIKAEIASDRSDNAALKTELQRISQAIASQGAALGLIGIAVETQRRKHLDGEDAGHVIASQKTAIARISRAVESLTTVQVRNVLAVKSQQCKHLVVEAAVRVNTEAIERTRSLEGPKAARIAQKCYLIESTVQDNVKSTQSMRCAMTVMNDTLARLTMK
ncbi:unnamed protein product [Arctogadus glacialis]